MSFTQRFIFRHRPPPGSPSLWELSYEERYARRARRFFLGAPLALAAAMAFLPAWLFLLYNPRFAHAQIAAGFVLPLLSIAAFLGVKQLASCLIEHPFDYLTAVSFGVLLIFAVVLLYTGVFLYVLHW